MVSFDKKNRKFRKSDFSGGSYIDEAEVEVSGDDGRTTGPDVVVGPSFLDEPSGSYPEPSRSKGRGSFILTGRNVLILGILGLVVAAWAFFAGLFIGLGFLMEDKAFIKMKAILSDKGVAQTTGEQNPDVVSDVEKDFLKLMGEKKPAGPPAPPPAEPAPPPEPPVKPETPPVETKGKYTVQVAATQTEADAKKLVADLKNQGYQAYFFHAAVEGRSYYRVRIGHFDTMTDAQAAMKKLDGHGFEGMFIWRLDDNS